ncbi:TetR/AcrR family transcriptional regulator [Corynebacterium auriscanis]|uniref:TetR/AcrR family transcriptional regulator n=1 Tax=Corynebacterium auriscanis TaxID=99807 RepID=UPI00224799D3|nr:TetR/AcrR family transcriptional regulator [Corynebacterium auriscanis]MCX2162340.1 TetR/AcrR family transcriptional regulator [Corynebacterium auriscanis]
MKPEPTHKGPAAPTSSEARLGLRDRKKAQTRRKLAEATVEIMLEHGVDFATITAICERAEVSQRTFHNYFPHREAAVVHFLENMLRWFCEEVGSTQKGLAPLDLAESLAKRFYMNPEQPLYSMAALGRLVGVIHSLDIDELRDQVQQDSEECFSPSVRFIAPLVDAFCNYFEDRIDRFTATMLVNTMLAICHTVWELQQDPALSRDRSAEAMLSRDRSPEAMLSRDRSPEAMLSRDRSPEAMLSRDRSPEAMLSRSFTLLRQGFSFTDAPSVPHSPPH